MIKVDIDLMHNFYYGHDLKSIFEKLNKAYSFDFSGMGYDDSDKNNIKDIELEAEMYLKENPDTPIYFNVKGEVKDNIIIFNNDYDNKSIIFKLDTGEYVY